MEVCDYLDLQGPLLARGQHSGSSLDWVNLWVNHCNCCKPVQISMVKKDAEVFTSVAGLILAHWLASFISVYFETCQIQPPFKILLVICQISLGTVVSARSVIQYVTWNKCVCILYAEVLQRGLTKLNLPPLHLCMRVTSLRRLRNLSFSDRMCVDKILLGGEKKKSISTSPSIGGCCYHCLFLMCNWKSESYGFIWCLAWQPHRST